MWKKYQNKKTNNKNLKLAFFALGILIILLLTAKLFSTFNSFKSPFSLKFNSVSNHSWNNKTSLNLIITSNNKLNNESKADNPDQSNIALVSLSPMEGKLTVLKISDQIYFDLPKGLGKWRVGSVFQLGEESKDPFGRELLKMSITKLTGVPIDGLIITPEVDKKSVEEIVSSFRNNPIAILGFLSNIKTDLSIWDSMKFVMAASNVRNDKIVSLDLYRSSITESELLPDSSRVLGVDTMKLDTFIRESLADYSISDENYSVAIFNATDHTGLAQDVSRIVTNLGANVTILGNTKEKSTKTIVIIRGGKEKDMFSDENKEEIKNSLIFQRLSGMYASECIKGECQSFDQEVNSSRAEISIVLGEDYFNYWYKN